MSPHKPRVLDLFCGAGGSARGYQEAGFHVVGVDIVGQPSTQTRFRVQRTPGGGRDGC